MASTWTGGRPGARAAAPALWLGTVWCLRRAADLAIQAGPAEPGNRWIWSVLSLNRDYHGRPVSKPLLGGSVAVTLAHLEPTMSWPVRLGRGRGPAW